MHVKLTVFLQIGTYVEHNFWFVPRLPDQHYQKIQFTHYKRKFPELQSATEKLCLLELFKKLMGKATFSLETNFWNYVLMLKGGFCIN